MNHYSKTNHTNTIQNESKTAQDYSEKLKTVNMPCALACSISRAIREQRCIFSNLISPSVTMTNYMRKAEIVQSDDVEFERWEAAGKFQAGMVLNLTMQLNVARDKSSDLIFPFTVRPLRINKTFYNSSDVELGKKFTDQLTKELKNKLDIKRPEFYFNITGHGNKRHIHGSVRLPASLYDQNNATANQPAYDALKRACGLTNRLRTNIANRDNRKKLYKFALSAPNMTGGFNEERATAHKRYGHMADFGEPLRADTGQIGWAAYIITGNNKSPNKIHSTKKLSGEAGRINDSLYRKIEELKSCGDLADNSPRFERIIKAWSDVMIDYTKSTSSDKKSLISMTESDTEAKTSIASSKHDKAAYVPAECDIDSRRSTSTIKAKTPELLTVTETMPSKTKPLEKKADPEGDKPKVYNVILKIPSTGTTLKDLIKRHNERSPAVLQEDKRFYYTYRTIRTKSPSEASNELNEMVADKQGCGEPSHTDIKAKDEPLLTRPLTLEECIIENTREHKKDAEAYIDDLLSEI